VFTPNVRLLWRTDGAIAEPGSVAIVVDILRASTTLSTAIALGVEDIFVTTEVEEARRVAADGACLLVGERDSRKIEGFDFSNSPTELQRQALGGASIAFTSTNFPHALEAAQGAGLVLVGAVVNLSAVLDAALAHAEEVRTDINLMLAGEPMESHAFEDYFFGGCAALALEQRCALDEAAQKAAVRMRNLDPSEVATHSAHAVELIRAGMGNDVEFAVQRDRFDVVGVLRDGRIRRL
jgi:2-phosphosulfolactate phosphatase